MTAKKKSYSLDEQILEVQRELAVRKKVYKDWVETGKMRRVDALRQYYSLQAVLVTLKALREKRDGKQTEMPI